MEYSAATVPEGHPVVEYGVRRILIVVAVMLASLLETLDSTIVNLCASSVM